MKHIVNFQAMKSNLKKSSIKIANITIKIAILKILLNME